MTSNNRLVVLALLAVSIALLIPGLFAPVLTIRGVLTRDGVAHVAPMMLERGLSDETVAVLKSMLNPAILAFMEAGGVDLRKTIIDKLTPAITNSLQRNVQEVPVYEQTRSIVGSVRQLYKVGSPVPATLILLFSVVVPVGKGALVAWAMFMADAARAGARCASWRRSPSGPWPTSSSWRCSSRISPRTPPKPSRGTPRRPRRSIAFSAHFGAGFYWFAAYCIFSLASQQYTRRLATATPAAPEESAAADDDRRG